MQQRLIRSSFALPITQLKDGAIRLVDRSCGSALYNATRAWFVIQFVYGHGSRMSSVQALPPSRAVRRQMFRVVSWTQLHFVEIRECRLSWSAAGALQA
jgi:hypothetical protein